MPHENGELLQRVVEVLAEVKSINQRLDEFLVWARARDREWEASRKENEAWRAENEAWRKENEAWRKQNTDDMRLIALTLQGASRVIQELDRRMTTLEQKRPGA